MKKSSPKKERIEIVIDRSKWKTGVCGVGDTYLLNEDGFMCCLGFISKAFLRKKRKNSTKPIFEICSPGELDIIIPELNEKIDDDDCIIDTNLSNKAMDINDDHLPLDVKEKRLKELFKNSPYKLKFIGKPIYES